jgi:hypothetical protein
LSIQEGVALQHKTDEQVVEMTISTGNLVREAKQQLSDTSQLLTATQQELKKCQTECSRLTADNKSKEEADSKYRLVWLQLIVAFKFL